MVLQEIQKTTTHFEAELQTVNKKILGKKTIKQCSTAQDIITESRNSREILASTVLDLYNICERTINAITGITEQLSKPLKENNVQNKSDDVCITQASLENAIKAQLQDILPNAIRTALVSVHSQINKPKENIQPSEIKDPDNTKHLLLVESKDDDLNTGKKKLISENEWVTVVRGKINDQLKDIPVQKASITKNGRAAVVLPDGESLEKAAASLGTDFNVTAISKKEVKLLPKIKIMDVKLDQLQGNSEDKNVLANQIVTKNASIKALVDKGDVFEIIYHNKKEEFLVVKVAPAIRKVIQEKSNKVHIGLTICNVEDQFHLIQCFHCQAYGHKAGSPHCQRKTEKPTCLYCAKDHKSFDCTIKKQKDQHSCANCMKSNEKHMKSNTKNHSSTDPLCPYVIMETKKVMSRTLGAEDSKNEYIKRIHRRQLKETR